jgi:hypothetical protein
MIGRILPILLLASGLASADTIDAYAVDGTRGEYNLWLYMSSTSGGTPSISQAYFTGVIDINLDSLYNRDTLCVDLFTDIMIGSTYYTTVLSPSQVTGRNIAELQTVAWLIDNELPAVNLAVQQGATAHGGAAAMGAGLQLAIWDITVDGGDGLSSGQVQAVTSSTPGATSSNLTDPNVLYWTNLYEQAAQNQSSDLAFVYVNYALNGNGGPNLNSPAQMLEGPQFSDGGPNPYPEPATLALAGGALIAIGHFARRRRRTGQASE